VLACPDVDSGDKSIYFEGDQGSMVSKSIGVRFEICEGTNCKVSKKEWLQDVQIDMWIIEEMIDQLKYDDRPTEQLMRRLNSHIFAEAITAKVIPVQQMSVIRNQFFMEDDWF